MAGHAAVVVAGKLGEGYGKAKSLGLSGGQFLCLAKGTQGAGGLAKPALGSLNIDLHDLAARA